MKHLSKNQIKKGAEEVSDAMIRIIGSNGSSFVKKILIMSFLFLFNINVTTPGNTGDSLSTMAASPIFSEQEIYVRTTKEKFKEMLITEVESYIKQQAPESRLSAEQVVDKCLEYQTDLIFVLAQGLLESHFGTKGIAVKTNSVWNVGAFDNQHPRNWYENADESIEPYLKLVNENYLINITSQGDTIYKDIYHLTQDKGYINKDGKRFASARGYENALRKLMIKIDAETSINFYQDIILLSDDKLLAYFSPINEVFLYDEMLAQN